MSVAQLKLIHEATQAERLLASHAASAERAKNWAIRGQREFARWWGSQARRELAEYRKQKAHDATLRMTKMPA